MGDEIHRPLSSTPVRSELCGTQPNHPLMRSRQKQLNQNSDISHRREKAPAIAVGESPGLCENRLPLNASAASFELRPVLLLEVGERRAQTDLLLRYPVTDKRSAEGRPDTSSSLRDDIPRKELLRLPPAGITVKKSSPPSMSGMSMDTGQTSTRL